MPTPRNKLVYSEPLNHTYILDSSGNQIGSMEGDQRNNPLAYDPGVADVQNVIPPYEKATIPNEMAQMGKDVVINAASNLPAFIPGIGPLGRMAGGGAITAAMERMLNPQKAPAEIAGSAISNAFLNELGPLLVEQKPKFRIPGMETRSTSRLVREPSVRESTSTSTGSSESKGSSQTVSSGRTATSRAASAESTRSGETTSTRGGESFTQHISENYPPTPEMINIQAEIERLKGIDTSKYKPGSVIQIENAIQRNQDALDALAEANKLTGILTKSEGAATGTSTGKTSTTSQGTATGTSQREGTGVSTRGTTSERQTMGQAITTPGAATRETVSTTVGGSKLERLLHAISWQLRGQPLTNWERAILGFATSEGADLTVNKNEK